MARPNFREEFDRDREFVAARVFPCAGCKFTPGQPFPKSLVNTRLLRQMYEQRYLRMLTAQEVLVLRLPKADDLTAAEFDKMFPDPVKARKGIERQRLSRQEKAGMGRPSKAKAAQRAPESADAP